MTHNLNTKVENVIKDGNRPYISESMFKKVNLTGYPDSNK